MPEDPAIDLVTDCGHDWVAYEQSLGTVVTRTASAICVYCGAVADVEPREDTDA